MPIGRKLPGRGTVEPNRRENMARATARRRAAQRRRAARRRRAILWALCVLLSVVLVVLVTAIVKLSKEAPRPVVQSVTVEAGSEISPAQFLKNPQDYQIAFDTDLSTIDMTQIGTYEIRLLVDGEIYTANLTVQDIVPPKGDPVPTQIRGGILPGAEELVTNIQDLSPVVVSYKQTPDLTQKETFAQVLLTDAAGNFTVIKVPLTVTLDETPPEIHGATDREFYVGDPINYKAADAAKGYTEVTATDNAGEAKLSVDRSSVDMNSPGTYPVIYTAADAAGNTTSVTVRFTLLEKPAGYVEPEIVYDLARDILETITTDDMTDMEVAFKIYYWTITNIDYVGSSDKSHWTLGAYQAFTTRSGDCFNYFAAAKALYDVAGIQNVDVVKSDTTHSSHYWSLINLGDGWYHVDCTPRSVWGAFFMNTDAELEKYSVANGNSHIFDPTAYPERATESVQHLLNYDNGTIKKAGE